MNRAENEAGSKAVDSLINYETVKYFNNEQHEIDRYDEVLQKYQAASLKTTTSLAFLNFGQNLIFSASLSAIMMLAAQKIMSVGEGVIIKLLYQFFEPKQGEIAVAGVNINDMDLENRRRNIAVVPQDPVLFH